MKRKTRLTEEKYMKKTQKVFSYLISGLFMAILMLWGNTYKGNAASVGVVDIQANRTYKTFDLDGDNKKDKIKLKISKESDDIFSAVRASIRINGKVVYKMPKIYRIRAGIKIITLQNGKSLIYFWSEDSQLETDDIIFRYRNGKIEEVINFQNIKELQKYNHGFFLYKNLDNALTVSGNDLKVKLNMCNWSVGVTELELVYQYKNNMLQRKNKGYMQKKRYKVAKAFSLYKKAGKGKKAFTAQKGEWFTSEKYCIKNGKLYLQFSDYKGRKGWIRSIDYPKTERSPLFKNVYYAG